MFEATFIQGTFFKQLIDALKDLVTEINLECTAEGLRAQAMESSHISLAELKIVQEAFDLYRCDRNIVLGLNMTSLSKVIRHVEAGDQLSINSGDKSDVVNIQITPKKSGPVSYFQLKLISLNPDTLSVTDETADTEITLPSSRFSQIVKELLNFGDTVQITSSKNSVDFTTSGPLGSAKISLKNTEDDNDDEKITIDCHDPVDQIFAIKFLTNFAKVFIEKTQAQPLAKEFIIHLSNSAPLCVECRLNDGEWGHIKYYLAPKANEEDE